VFQGRSGRGQEGIPVAITVSNDNFVRAETDRMFASIQAASGGVNRWHHLRAPTAVDEQTVIRMNRDTMYSMALVDLSRGATVTIPWAGDRYVSVMVVNEDHYINKIFHAPGEHTLTPDDFDTPYVVLAARVLVDPSVQADVERVNAIQDGFSLTAGSNEPFVMPEYDEKSFTATREAVLEEGRQSGGLKQTHGVFGTKADVNPSRHRIGTAMGWGGLPEYEATYVSEEPGLPVGAYCITAKDVPVDAFWSITVYNKAGFFEKNSLGVYSVNDVTGVPNDDGSLTVHLGGDENQVNHIPLPEGWNYIVRLYRPRPEVLDGTWTFPPLEPVSR
jgi:hypothetical protein